MGTVVGDEATPVVAADHGAPTLTARENEIAFMVASGSTNRQIAALLVISVRTVEGHVEHARHKLGLATRGQIAAVYEAGLDLDLTPTLDAIGELVTRLEQLKHTPACPHRRTAGTRVWVDLITTPPHRRT